MVRGAPGQTSAGGIPEEAGDSYLGMRRTASQFREILVVLARLKHDWRQGCGTRELVTIVGITGRILVRGVPLSRPTERAFCIWIFWREENARTL